MEIDKDAWDDDDIKKSSLLQLKSTSGKMQIFCRICCQLTDSLSSPA